MVLDSFIKRSSDGGYASPVVEVLADTAVALASANVQLVAKKIIGRLCRVCFFSSINRNILIFLCALQSPIRMNVMCF